MRWRVGEGRAVGSFALLVTLLTYASPPGDRTLWRWSYFEGGLLLAVALIFGVTLLGLLMPATGPIDGGYRAPGSRVAAHWLDLGWALWGLGYVVGSVFAPASRGRFLQLDLFGSVVPAGAFLEWGGAVAGIIALGMLIWRRVGQRSWILTISLCTLLAAFAGGEGWARWTAMYRPRVTAIPSLTDARWRRRNVTLNAEGSRDVTHQLAKAEGSSRLLLVGGSDAFGVGIADPDDRLGEVLALRLAAATGRPWESIDVGRVGTHTKDHLALLEGALRYRPDVVVLLYSFDDIAYFAPVRQREFLAEPSRDWRDRLHPLRLLYVNSMLFQEGYLRLRARLPAYTGGGPLAHDPYADSTIVAGHIEDLSAFVQAAEETGAATVVVPVDVDVASDPARRTRSQAFVAAVRAAEVPVLAVDSAFTGYAEGRLVVGPAYRHPNELAVRLVAASVARQVLDLLGGTPGAGKGP